MRGLLAGTLAGSVWGLALVVPAAIPEVSAVHLAFARMLGFGIISALSLWGAPLKAIRETLRRHFGNLLVLALLGHSLYYACLCVSVRWAGVILSSLILGILPLAGSLLANWIGLRSDRVSFRKLILPAILICLGMFASQWTPDGVPEGVIGKQEHLVPGVLLATLCTVMWALYAVWNGTLLRTRKDINPRIWTGLMGVFAGLTSPILSFVGARALGEAPLLEQLADPQILKLWLIGAVVLGTGPSWLSNWAWNRCSQLLPTALATQLIVFETISAIFCAWILEARLPRVHELVALTLCVVGVVFGVRLFAQRSA